MWFALDALLPSIGELCNGESLYNYFLMPRSRCSESAEEGKDLLAGGQSLLAWERNSNISNLSGTDTLQ